MKVFARTTLSLNLAAFLTRLNGPLRAPLVLLPEKLSSFAFSMRAHFFLIHLLRGVFASH